MKLNNGYKLVCKPEHHRAWSTGYVYEHVLKAEEKLGRLLATSEVVHHKDGNKLNNSLDNLEVMAQAEHAKHHHTGKAIRLMCSMCGKVFTRKRRNTPEVKGYKRAFCNRECYYKALSD